MNIQRKLNTAFISLIVLLLISSAVAMFNSSRVKSKVDEALSQRVEQIRTIDEIRVGIGLQGKFIRELMTNNTPDTKEQLDHYATYVDEQIAKLEKISTTETMNSYLKEINNHNNEFNTNMSVFIGYIDANNRIEAENLLDGDLAKANNGILEVAEKMTDFQDKQLKDIKKETNSALSSSNIISIVLLVISIFIGLFLMYYVRKNIVEPLKEMVSVSQKIASGYLVIEDLKVSSKDEIGQLTEANNTMKNNLRSLISHIQANTEHLSAAAEELSASTEEVTATTEEMASRSSETLQAAASAATAANESAKATEETATGVQRIAESTQILNDSSVDTFKTAQSGSEIIHRANEQMSTINISSQMVNELVQKLSRQTVEIEKITNVITDITEQTNLLALNAAIEAARAGEHGKGFAVVADEVRKLAEESNASANQIVEVIKEIKMDTKNVEKAAGDSLDSVKDGVEIIGNAGNAFKEIVAAVQQMTNQIQEISATSEELSASAEQVSASAVEIAQAANLSTANVENIAAALEEQTATMEQVNGVAIELSQNAQELQEEIQKFKI